MFQSFTHLKRVVTLPPPLSSTDLPKKITIISRDVNVFYRPTKHYKKHTDEIQSQLQPQISSLQCTKKLQHFLTLTPPPSPPRTLFSDPTENDFYAIFSTSSFMEQIRKMISNLSDCFNRYWAFNFAFCFKDVYSELIINYPNNYEVIRDYCIYNYKRPPDLLI